MDKFLNKLKMLILVLGDIAVLYLSLFLTLFIRYYPNFNYLIFKEHLLPFSFIYILWLVIFYINGIYDFKFIKNNIIFLKQLSQVIIASAFLSIIFFYLIPYFNITPKTNLFLNILIFTIIFSLWRRFFNKFASLEFLKSRVLFIGNNIKEVGELIDFLRNNQQFGYEVVGIIEESNLETIKNKIEQDKIDLIVFTKDLYNLLRISKVFYNSIFLKVKFVDLISFYEVLMKKVPLSAISEIWFIENLKEADKKVYDFFKKIIDKIAAFIFLIVFLIILPLVALLIKIDDGGPIFYRQKRIGSGGKIFSIIKFRTMIIDAEKNGPQWTVAANDKRITRIGSILRKTRIDEIPQIINILKGDMSLIGPRPERPEFVAKFIENIPFYNIRHLVKPGITGWAQVNFKYAASTEENLEKLQYDIYYIKNRSLVLDFMIFLKTLNIIFRALGQ